MKLNRKASSTTGLSNLIQRGVLSAIFILLSGCSSIWGFGDVTQFQILEQGKNRENRPNMAEVCKGFYISEQKFNDFFKYAKVTYEQTINPRYKALPCYSAGVAYLNNETFNWTIRAGGVGEFYNDKTSFTKVCGVACCAKVEGVC